jgi:hypothetical protein
MKGIMRKAVILALIALVSASASVSDGASAPVAATAIQIDPADPAHVRFGRLRYLSGWVLKSKQIEFGGYSSLRVEGDRFLTLADTGNFLSFRMAKPGVIDQASFGRIPDFPGRSGTKSDRDSESMAIDPASGRIWVGFEVYNAIFRYAAGFAATEARSEPPEMTEWPTETGPESLARLSDGRFVVLSENAALKNGAKEALLFPGDPTVRSSHPVHFSYRPPDGYLPTDAAELPDGRLVVLNRHFSMMDGFWAALTIIDPRAVRPGQELTGELLAEFRPPLNIDNMEGVSVVREGARTILWIISDDNQMPVQRTLLLKFALDDQPGR